MHHTLSAILFSSLLVINPAFGSSSEDPAQKQQVDDTKVADIQTLLQRWAQLRPGMTLDEVEATVGPLEPAEKKKIESLVQIVGFTPPSMQNMPSVVNMTQEIRQSYSIHETTISFKLVFNTKRKLLKYWLDYPSQNGR